MGSTLFSLSQLPSFPRGIRLSYPRGNLSAPLLGLGPVEEAGEAAAPLAPQSPPETSSSISTFQGAERAQNIRKTRHQSPHVRDRRVQPGAGSSGPPVPPEPAARHSNGDAVLKGEAWLGLAGGGGAAPSPRDPLKGTACLLLLPDPLP